MTDQTTETARGTKQLLLDPGRCIGCKSCAAACFLGHQRTPGLFCADVGESTAMPMPCRQCEEAPCVAACPNDAMYTDQEGVVRRSVVLCTGCRCCQFACPFGVIDEIERHQVGKCDLCVDRTRNGLLPRCVAICPSGALRFEVLDQELAEKGYRVVGGRIACVTQ
jgi:Fe-S-cluster-containing dehydrogenase component